jgi:hypothetical protein
MTSTPLPTTDPHVDLSDALDDLSTDVQRAKTAADRARSERAAQAGVLAGAREELDAERLAHAATKRDLEAALKRIEELTNPTPNTSFFVGMAYLDNTDPAPFEKRAGAVIGGRRTYFDLSPAKMDALIATAQADKAAGRVSVLSVKLAPGMKWAQAVAGAADAACTSLAGRLDALGTRVYIAVHSEPEGDTASGTIAEWTAMQARLSQLFDIGNVRYTIIVQGWPQLYPAGRPSYPLATIWPKGAPVKCLGVDVYHSYGYDGQNSKWTNHETAYWEAFEAFAKANGIEWGVAETGFTDKALTDRAEAKTCIADDVAAVKRHGASFYLYFNRKGTKPDRTWLMPAGSPKELQLQQAVRAEA